MDIKYKVIQDGLYGHIEGRNGVKPFIRNNHYSLYMVFRLVLVVRTKDAL